ncbi:MAG TPA: hypothetical protein QGG47_09815 [Acidobacteriota bacterium]|nr:hypothetical protein [Acidobacteriota bacterium]
MFVPRLIQAVPLSAATLALLYVFVPTVALRWEVAGAGLGLMALMMIAWHGLAPRMVAEDTLAENILLIGDGALAYQIADQIGSAAPWGFRLIGYVPVDDEASAETRTAPSTIAQHSHFDGASSQALALDTDSRVLPFPVPVRIDAPALGRLQDLNAILDERDAHTIVVALNDRRGKLPLAALIASDEENPGEAPAELSGWLRAKPKCPIKLQRDVWVPMLAVARSRIVVRPSPVVNPTSRSADNPRETRSTVWLRRALAT